MAASLTFTLDDTAVQKKLGQMLGDVKDFTQPFEKAGESMLAYFGQDVFEQQGVAGESWRALAESTLKARASRSGYYAAPPITTDKILVWTGRLKSGFKKQVTKVQLRIFNDVDYFKYHQTRGGRPPQRRMLALTANVVAEIIEQVHRYAAAIVQK